MDPSPAPNLRPAVYWTPHNRGMQDYDGNLLSISCRFYPNGYYYHAMIEGQVQEVFVEHPPLAVCRLLLRFTNTEGEQPYEDALSLAERHFQAPTEAEVKAQVEAWAGAQLDSVAGVLRTAFEFRQL